VDGQTALIIARFAYAFKKRRAGGTAVPEGYMLQVSGYRFQPECERCFYTFENKVLQIIY